MSNNCNYKPTERIGLYIMVFMILLSTCSMEDKINKMNRQMDKIEKRVVEKTYGE